MAIPIFRSTLIFVVLAGCAIFASAVSPMPLSPFDEAVQKLNNSGYTSFVSLVNAYGKMKQVKAALSKPLTMLVPSNAAIAKVKITSYSTAQLSTLVMFNAIKGVMPFQKLRSLAKNSTLATLSTDLKSKKSLILTKLSPLNARWVAMQGKPGSKLMITKGDFYLKAVIWTFPQLLSPEAESDPSLALAVIWSLAPLLSPEAESDAALPSRLATLCDHFGAVSSVRWAGSGKEWEGVKRCGVGEGLGRKVHESGLSSHLATLCDHFGAVSSVRWSHNGLHLATAADDQTVHVHGRRERWRWGGGMGIGWSHNGLHLATAADDQTVHVYGRREGRGSVVFGEMDAPNVENWTLMHSLRGHTGEVVSPFASPAAALSYICENEEVNWGRQAGGVGERDGTHGGSGGFLPSSSHSLFVTLAHALLNAVQVPVVLHTHSLLGCLGRWALLTWTLTHSLRGHTGEVVSGDGGASPLSGVWGDGRPAPNVEDNWTLMHSLASAVLALTLPALLFGEMHAPNVENWALMHSLRGHTGEVVDVDWSPDDSLVATCSLDSTVDVDWSPDDSLIATCSLDSTVRIWQPMTGRQVAVLTGHSSFVKGVAWDPIGRFLGSQSDDKSVIVWRVNDWSVAKRVEGPYPKSVGATFFRRLSFSPCGSYLTTVHAFADPNHTAAILDRTLGWAKTLDYVGHTGPVTVARSPCGLHMLCCSADGTVAAFLFDQSELGIPLTHREMDGRIASLYGHRHVAASHSLVEDPELLALQQQRAAAATHLFSSLLHIPPHPDASPSDLLYTTPSDLLCSLNGHVLWRDRLPSPVTAIAGCPTLFLPFRPPLLLTNQTPLTLTCSVPSTAMCCGGTDCFILSLPFPTVLPTPPSLPLPHPDTTPSDLLCSLNGHVLWRDRLPSPVTAIAGCDPAVSAHPSTLSPSPGASLWAVACSLSFLVRLPLRLSPFRPTAASSLPSTLSSSSPGASLWAVACANHSLLVRLLLLAQPLPVTAIAGCPPSSAASHPSTLSPSPGASLWAVACANHSLLVRLPLLPGKAPSPS
ncbi:unnamed protein product, partial [Closterium sp. NIES-65]